MTTLTALQKLALTNVKLSNEERKMIAPGKHDVAFTVRVNGTLSVAEPEPYTPTSSIPLLPTIALALKKMGVQRENFLKVLEASMNEVLTSDTTVREALVKEVGLTDYEKALRKMIGKLPKKVRVGRVKAALKATVHKPRKKASTAS